MDQENWVPPKFVPVCLSSNLRSCTMKDFEFSGQQSSHIMLARFVMENARILETMSILCYGKWYEIKRALSACPRASATCQLSIDNIYDDYVSSGTSSLLSFVSLASTLQLFDLVIWWTMSWYESHCFTVHKLRKNYLNWFSFFLHDLFEKLVLMT